MLGLMRWHVLVPRAYHLQVYLWGCYYCEHLLHIDTLEHTDTSHERYLDYSTHRLHRTVLLLVGAREHCCVRRRSTSSEAYRRWGDTSSSRVAHITYRHSTLTRAITRSFPQLMWCIKLITPEYSCNQSVLCAQIHLLCCQAVGPQ